VAHANYTSNSFGLAWLPRYRVVGRTSANLLLRQVCSKPAALPREFVLAALRQVQALARQIASRCRWKGASRELLP